MFCYQKNFSNPTLPVDEAQFWALVRATQWNENIDKYRETGEASLKRKLPAFIFQATFDETASAKGKMGRWRKQAATRLTGLVVMDVDHVESEELRVKSEEFAAADFKQRAAELGILLIYITPSGYGLKIVFKARTEWGNLIDNQHAMAKVLGVEVDESCKDASRMSFICKESDILFIDKELFTYENKEFGEKFDAEYRAGHSQGNTQGTGTTVPCEHSTGGSQIPADAPTRSLSPCASPKLLMTEREIVMKGDEIRKEQIEKENAPADGCLTISEIAELLKTSVKDLNQFLVKQDIQFRRDGRYYLTPKYEGSGFAQERAFHYFSLEGEKKERIYLVWTPLGVEFIRHLYFMNN